MVLFFVLVIVSKTAVPTRSNLMSSSVPGSSVGKSHESGNLFISGLLFLIIAIIIMVIG